MAKSDAEKKKDFLKKHGLKRFNSCVIRTEGGKKGKVGILVNGKPRLIRFGDASMGHNYSPEARKSFKARHLRTLRKVRQVLHTGLTNVYGQVEVVLKRVHQKVKSMLKVQGRN